MTLNLNFSNAEVWADVRSLILSVSSVSIKLTATPFEMKKSFRLGIQMMSGDQYVGAQQGVRFPFWFNDGTQEIFPLTWSIESWVPIPIFDIKVASYGKFRAAHILYLCDGMTWWTFAVSMFNSAALYWIVLNSKNNIFNVRL